MMVDNLGPVLEPKSDVYDCETFFSLPESLTNRMPNEIHDNIIDHLHNDKETLAACALVSSSWLPSARYHFRTSAQIKRKANVHSFLDIIRAPWNLNTLAPAIQSLSIYTSEFVDPAELTPYLPALRRLYISGAARDYGPHGCLKASELSAWFHPLAHQLTNLALGHAICASFANFASMLPDFMALRHLALINVTWRDPYLPFDDPSGQVQTSNSKAEFPRIRSLVLTGQNIHLVPYLLVQGVNEIERLDLRVDRHKTEETMRWEIRDIIQYIQLLGSSLHELYIYDDFFLYPTDPLMDLSYHPNLQTLQFHGVDLADVDYWVQSLVQITSPLLHTLTIYSYLVGNTQHTDAQMLDGLESIRRAVLLNKNFASLRKVQLKWLFGEPDLPPAEVIASWNKATSEMWTIDGREVPLEICWVKPSFSVLVPDRGPERWFDD